MKKIHIVLTLVLILLSLDALADATFTLPSGVRVEVIEPKFQPNQFRISGCKANDEYCRINGQIPFGVQSAYPKTYVKAIKVSYKGRTYSLDSSNMYDACGPRSLEAEGAIRYFGGACSDAANCQFRGVFSDASGTFVAEWRIVDSYAVRTVLTDASDIVELFMRHIDPPELN